MTADPETQALLDNASHFSPHQHSGGGEVLLTSILAGFIGAAAYQSRLDRRNAEYQRALVVQQDEIESRFVGLEPHPVDEETGLHFPDMVPAEGEKIYADLAEGLAVAEECDGLAEHDTFGPLTYAQIHSIMSMLEHDAAVIFASQETGRHARN
jgi:hypothetical protein